jgi:RimJ/RimL family protein N-acetyltransferase
VSATRRAHSVDQTVTTGLEAPLETSRLRLEPLRVEHAKEMVEVLADPSLYTFTGENPPDLSTLSDRYRVLEQRVSPDGSQRWLNWILRARDTHRTIGYVQATVERDSRATIAYVIGTPWQRRGLASEAVCTLVDSLRRNGVSTIVANIAPDNAGSARVAEAAGLHKTRQRTDEGEDIWTSENSGASV